MVSASDHVGELWYYYYLFVGYYCQNYGRTSRNNPPTSHYAIVIVAMSRQAKQPRHESKAPCFLFSNDVCIPLSPKLRRLNKTISTESDSEPEDAPPTLKKPKPTVDPDSDSGMEATPDEEEPTLAVEGTISSVQLLAARRDKLAHEKLRIGALCSSLLESPEKKVNV